MLNTALRLRSSSPKVFSNAGNRGRHSRKIHNGLFYFQPHFRRLISSTSLAKQPGLVVAKMRSSCARTRPPWFLRIVSIIPYFSAEGHFVVSALRFTSNSMPESFPLAEFLLLHQCDWSKYFNPCCTLPRKVVCNAGCLGGILSLVSY